MKDGGAQHLNSRSETTTAGVEKPYFEMSAEERASFVAKAQAIEIGDTRQAVEAALGKPCNVRRVASRETGEYLGHFVVYCLRQQAKNRVNVKLDETVLFTFDTGDHLVKIVSDADDIQSRP